MIVDAAVYHDGVRTPVDCEDADYAALRARASERGGFVWVGLHEPDPEELSAVAEAFDLHPLAVEDAVKAHQRPKLERYEHGLFLVLKTLWYVDEEDAVETGEVNLFVGPDFVVTVRHGHGLELSPARSFLESSEQVLTHGPSSVVYAVCDRVVDAYVAVVDELQVDVDEVEESVLSPARTNDSVRIYTLKREIAEVRRAVQPLREPLHRFSDGAVHGVDPEAGPFFRDVLDHLNRTAELVDNLDALLSTAFDVHVARIQLQQNDDMRKISAGAALVVVPTLIAGVYGMNFESSPSPNSVFGFWFALSLMLVTSVGIWISFRRSGWF